MFEKADFSFFSATFSSIASGIARLTSGKDPFPVYLYVRASVS